jgi:hypothetical protein
MWIFGLKINHLATLARMYPMASPQLMALD